MKNLQNLINICAHCGANGYLKQGSRAGRPAWYVECVKCGAMSGFTDSQFETIVQWNRRVQNEL